MRIDRYISPALKEKEKALYMKLKERAERFYGSRKKLDSKLRNK